MNRQALILANVEAVCLEVTREKSQPILNASVYRPPNSQVKILKEIRVLFQNLARNNAYKSLRNKIDEQIIHPKRHYYTDCIDRNKNNTK